MMWACGDAMDLGISCADCASVRMAGTDAAMNLQNHNR
eukprot:CAMPEP_0117535396 /NCGR_PEP_ID=MMETSP0784-20121206/40913_1 /TAXON_ID=39447 /ORGANISM="" /LENGTH=37 /DNA_ID= /DNA_START= /DNA_END= /DNA_ORIENTATION=